MASLKSIRNRIRSVKSTQQITKAMKMVAAAKLRKSQDRILAARPYAVAMDQVLGSVATRADLASHPLLAQRPEPKRVDIVVMTSDRGLCGGFNANIVRRAQRFLIDNQDRYEQITVSCIGRKGYEFFNRRGVKLRKQYLGVFEDLTPRRAQDIADELATHFVKNELDAIYLLYNEFVSAISQRVSLVQLLPLGAAKADAKVLPVDYLYEPNRPEVLDRLLPKHLGVQLYRALLESQAAELGARMSAMDSATNNASDMIGRLTLMYNRTRQAAITKELMEIVSGAEALK